MMTEGNFTERPAEGSEFPDVLMRHNPRLQSREMRRRMAQAARKASKNKTQGSLACESRSAPVASSVPSCSRPSRTSPADADWHRLIELAGLTDTLIGDADGI